MRWFPVVFAFAVVTLLATPIVAAAQPAQMPPGIMWHSLLGTTVMYSNTGNFSPAGFERLVAVFLPPAQSNTTYPYNPDDGGKFWAILSAADGTQLARCDFWAQERPAPYWFVDDVWMTDLTTGERNHTKQMPLPPGDYTMDYFLDTGRFYTFSFSVTKIDSDDPFRPQTYWFLDGPWRDWGYLTYPSADPSGSLKWVIFLHNKGREASKDVSIQITVTRDADGTVVCASRPGMSWSLAREWKSYGFELAHPNGMIFPASELLGRDGAYTLRMTVDGQIYGTWAFQVAGGQLQYAGRALRGAVDQLEFIEGGPDRWWYIRQESGQAAEAPTATAGGQPAAEPAAPATPAGDQPAATTGATGEVELIPGGAPIQVNGTTMVPLRAIFEWLGADVKFIAQANTIIAQRGDTIVLLRTDSTTATVNGKQQELTQMPIQHQGSTYVPLRFVAEAFGCQVSYDAASGTATVIDGDRVGAMIMQ